LCSPAACAYPLVADGYNRRANTAYFFVWVFIALSLCPDLGLFAAR